MGCYILASKNRAQVQLFDIQIQNTGSHKIAEVKGTVQRQLTGVESGAFELSGQPFSFFILKGYCHERSIKLSSKSSQLLN